MYENIINRLKKEENVIINIGLFTHNNLDYDLFNKLNYGK